MSPFRFRLETLLRLRIAERDQRRSDLAKALRAEDVLRADEQRLASERAEVTGQARRQKSPGAANVDVLLQTHRYEIVLAARARQLATQLAEVAAETERRRQALVEADRQVRILEKLRERKALAHRQSAERLEIKQFDELASIGHSRQREVAP
jgi:flagellar protein FliJ